jgi:hypothetical protein
MAQYSSALKHSALQQLQSRFTQVEGMTEEIRIEVENYFTADFESGPDFAALRQLLSSKFELEATFFA